MKKTKLKKAVMASVTLNRFQSKAETPGLPILKPPGFSGHRAASLQEA